MVEEEEEEEEDESAPPPDDDTTLPPGTRHATRLPEHSKPEQCSYALEISNHYGCGLCFP